MGIIINQSLRNAGISYIGIGLGFISSILLFPNILDTEKFGLTRSLLAISIISVQLVNLGLPNALIKFFPDLSEKDNRSEGLLWVFMIPPLVGFIVFCLVLLVFQNEVLSLYSSSSLLSEYYFYILPLVAFLASFALLNSFVKASLNTVFASFLQDIFLRLIIILDLGLYFFELISFDGFMLIFVGNYGLQYILLLLYALKNKYLCFSLTLSPFTPSKIKELSRYSVFAFFSGFTMILVGNIDLLMVDVFKGLEQTGIYAVALYVGAVIAIPKRTITKISFPIIAKSFKENDLANISNIYKQSSLNQFLIGILIYIGVLANMDNLYSMLPDTFEKGSIVIIIIGLANLFDMITGANGQIIISSKYYKFDFIASFILMTSAIILNLILIPEYGIAGAATATASSIFLFNFVKVIYVWIKFNMQPFSLNTLGIIVLGLSVLYLSSFLPKLSSIYLDIPVRSLLMATLYLGSVWFFNLSDEVNTLMKNFFIKLKGG